MVISREGPVFPVFPPGSEQQVEPLAHCLPLLCLGEGMELAEAKHAIFSRAG